MSSSGENAPPTWYCMPSATQAMAFGWLAWTVSKIAPATPRTGTLTRTTGAMSRPFAGSGYSMTITRRPSASVYVSRKPSLISMLVSPVTPENCSRVSSRARVRGSSIALIPVAGGAASRTLALDGAIRRKLEASTAPSRIAPDAGSSQRARHEGRSSMTPSRSSIKSVVLPRTMVWRGTIRPSMGRSPLDGLLAFSDPELGVGWNPRASRAARWRLGRMRALLDLAGAPDRTLRVVLIAGTKGKGSTAAFTAAILHAGGARAGLFTSPHLQTYRERVRIDGAMLAESRFDRAIDDLRPIVARLRRAHPAAGEPTTFELTLLLAMRAFAERGCAIAIVEVGLGGRIDATNALDPVISAITPVSYDHTAILGRTLAAIALEKAGIVRRGRPALVAEQRPAAARAIARVCRAAGADLRVVAPLGVHADLGLTGDHQRQNAALATAIAAELGFDRAAIARGLRSTRWPARLARVRRWSAWPVRSRWPPRRGRRSGSYRRSDGGDPGADLRLRRAHPRDRNTRLPGVGRGVPRVRPRAPERALARVHRTRRRLVRRAHLSRGVGRTARRSRRDRASPRCAQDGARHGRGRDGRPAGAPGRRPVARPAAWGVLELDSEVGPRPSRPAGPPHVLRSRPVPRPAGAPGEAGSPPGS